MKTYYYKFWMRLGKQEYQTGGKRIIAQNVDQANKELNKLDLPFHHFSTVELINK